MRLPSPSSISCQGFAPPSVPEGVAAGSLFLILAGDVGFVESRDAGRMILSALPSSMLSIR